MRYILFLAFCAGINTMSAIDAASDGRAWWSAWSAAGAVFCAMVSIVLAQSHRAKPQPHPIGDN